MVKFSQIQFGYLLSITMTNTEQSTHTADGLKSITGLTDQEYEALTAALVNMRAPKAEDFGAHSKMLSAVRNQLQQRLNSNVSDDEKTKLMHDIAELDRKMNAIHQ
jgi:hypothetical protein